MGAFDSTLGALLLAVVANTYLFGIGVYQYLTYFTSDFCDPAWIKWTLAGLFTTDTFHSCIVVYMAWTSIVESFTGPSEIVLGTFWPLPLSIACVTLSAFVVQSFLSYRVLLLARSKVLAAACLVLAAGAFGMGILVTVKAWSIPVEKKQHIHDLYVTIWLLCEVAVDLLIAGILLFVLRKEASESTQSNRVIRRLGRVAIQTGLCSSIFAIICMVLWLVRPRANWYLIFGLPIGRVYTCSLLDTLISRSALRAMMNSQGGLGHSIVSTLIPPYLTSEIDVIVRATLQTNVRHKHAFLAEPDQSA
ncbi:hypothetical protein BKA70DRAFT_1445319 [Coprinopsis sp. MPI-PUGE-AT-0042]|nr:hypothetical protein BKA70DRAFT_1445319 [Coprinopsis sp. MPI-PUGE-AT-0042]